MAVNEIKIKMFKDPSEATNYNFVPGMNGSDLKEAAIVKNGTKGGRSTIDLIFEDAEGKKYIAMVTGRILKSITNLIQDED